MDIVASGDASVEIKKYYREYDTDHAHRGWSGKYGGLLQVKGRLQKISKYKRKYRKNQYYRKITA